MKKFLLALAVMAACLGSLHAVDNGLTPGNMRNLSPLIDAILRISTASGPAGDTGPTGPAGPSGTPESSTITTVITIGGEIVYSSATPPFFPGAWWTGSTSSCTITKVQAVVQNPSAASAVFPFYAVQQSSWQWSQYPVLAVTTATQRSEVRTVSIVVSSSNSFIVGVASAPVSNPASNLGLWFQHWCAP